MELITKTVLFPATSELDMERKLFERMGFPTEETWPSVTTLARYNDMYPQYEMYRGRELELPAYDAQAQDLINKMLVLNPANRITAKDAELHDYFQELR
jgi:serine/threonine protein kinase